MILTGYHGQLPSFLPATASRWKCSSDTHCFYGDGKLPLFCYWDIPTAAVAGGREQPSVIGCPVELHAAKAEVFCSSVGRYGGLGGTGGEGARRNAATTTSSRTSVAPLHRRKATTPIAACAAHFLLQCLRARSSPSQVHTNGCCFLFLWVTIAPLSVFLSHTSSSPACVPPPSVLVCSTRCFLLCAYRKSDAKESLFNSVGIRLFFAFMHAR